MPGVPRKNNSAADVAPRTANSAGPPGVNPAQARLLARIGLRTLADLALHLPLRYDDETRLSTIAEATPVCSPKQSARLAATLNSPPLT